LCVRIEMEDYEMGSIWRLQVVGATNMDIVQ
jgi:hypothetical protein